MTPFLVELAVRVAGEQQEGSAMNKREFLKRAGVALPAAVLVSPAQAQRPATGASANNVVNAASFGTITANDRGYDNTIALANHAAIQAAINYAFANRKQIIRLPDVGYPIYMPEKPLWLDDPANHPSDVYKTGAAINFNLSLWLVGSGAANLKGFGTNLYWKDNYGGKCLVIGPGAGMGVQGVSIRTSHTAASCRAARPSTSIGIAYTGGPGGGSRCMLRDVGVFGHHTLVKTGWNEDQLADRLRIENSWLDNGYYGLHIAQTQNFLVEVRDSDITNCVYNVYNPQQFAVNFTGGGCHPVGGTAAVFTIGSVSALTAAGNSYTFSAAVTAPSRMLADGGYNRFVVKTASFGAIPCTWASYRAGTITLRIRDSWRLHHFGLLNVVSLTDLQAELQAATKLFCVEMGTNFYGSVRASEFHTEAPLPYVLLDTSSTSATHPSWIKGVHYNGEPAATDMASAVGADSANEARYLVAQTHPHIDLGTYAATIEDINFANTYVSNGIMVDMQSSGFTTDYFFARLAQAQLNVRHHSSSGNVDGNEEYGANPFKGFGRFDRTPFLPRTNLPAINFLTRSDNAVAHKGYRPDPSCTPALTPNQYAIVSASLAAVNLGAYPLIHGGTIYKVMKDGERATARRFVSSAHVGFSYGQDLTTAKVGSTLSWSFKGASNCVYMDAASVGFMFPGLGIILNFAGADHEMIVTGVYPMNRGTTGYVTVSKATIGTGIVTHAVNDGNKTTTYTGSSIKQAPYVWTSNQLS
jgi:hypothetical protein